MALTAGIELVEPDAIHAEEVLTPEALSFVAQLHRSFNAERERLLADRWGRQQRLDAGEMPDFLPNPIESRDADRARMTRYAEAYRSVNGPSAALVDAWVAAVGREK